MGKRKSSRAIVVSGLAPRVERAIQEIRGVKAILDEDIAALYGVTTGALNQAVRRNAARFPEDFMFKLTEGEAECLLSQIVIANGEGRRGGRRTPPWAFTEQGVAMLSSVLKSPRAVAVNLEIMRAFARFRRLIAGHSELAKRLGELERAVGRHDGQIRQVFDAMRQLIETPPPSRPAKRPIGFQAKAGDIELTSPVAKGKRGHG